MSSFRFKNVRRGFAAGRQSSSDRLARMHTEKSGTTTGYLPTSPARISGPTPLPTRFLQISSSHATVRITEVDVSPAVARHRGRSCARVARAKTSGWTSGPRGREQTQRSCWQCHENKQNTTAADATDASQPTLLTLMLHTTSLVHGQLASVYSLTVSSSREGAAEKKNLRPPVLEIQLCDEPCWRFAREWATLQRREE